MGDFFFLLSRRTSHPSHLQFSHAARPVLLLFSPTYAAKTFLSPPAGGFCLLIFDAVLCLVSPPPFFRLPYHIPSALISILAFISASLNSLSLFFFPPTVTLSSTHSVTSSFTRSSEPPATYQCASIAAVWRIVLQNRGVSSASRQLSRQLQVNARHCHARTHAYTHRHVQTVNTHPRVWSLRPVCLWVLSGWRRKSGRLPSFWRLWSERGGGQTESES